MMKVAVIGAGGAGGAIARAVAKAGHSVVVSAVDQEHAKQAAEQAGGSVAASNEQAASEADLVVLAVPFQAIDAVAEDIRRAVDGKIVVDASNPLKPDYSGLAVTERAGAEHVQEKLPSAKVVKAFNTAFSGNHDDPQVGGVALDGFLAGDDASAKSTVGDLLAQIGFRPLDVGGLSLALVLEHMAFLNISFNARNNLPWRSGWKLVGPTGQ
jgi:8-hydroxy-5-deazaflavin:NADPH oxidoreductase